MHTPAAHHSILMGVTRESIIELARREGLTVKEGTYLTFDIYTADEVWITGTGADLVPVVEVDGRSIADGRPGRTFRLLRSRWKDYINEASHHSVVPTRESVLVD